MGKLKGPDVKKGANNLKKGSSKGATKSGSLKGPDLKKHANNG